MIRIATEPLQVMLVLKFVVIKKFSDTLQTNIVITYSAYYFYACNLSFVL